MRNNTPLLVILLSSILAVAASCQKETLRTEEPAVQKAEEMPFMNPRLPIEDRVWDLVGRLTLAEKVSQLSYDSPAIDRLGVPAYNWWNECELSARLQNPSGGRDFRARRAMNTPGRPRSAGGVATELRSPKRPGIHAPDRFGNSAGKPSPS